ncbi:MAG: ABC transporter ATP-binding protein [Hyphomonadaceae bacterium]|nr:ABC transporter ATP-binding protein [Hyphomonadaceae bacterium]
MNSNIAIRAEGLGKRYKLGALGSQHNSLRDALQAAFRPKKASGPTEFWALKDASFEIKRGENVGIVGLNGAGKSTLLKTLSQIVTPTTGKAEITGRLGALLEVGTGFHRELTGRENVFLYGSILGMSRAEVATKFDQIIAFSEIEKFIDTPVKRYSSGMYVRLAFAVAANLDPDILLLDEVLAVGDLGFQKKCIDFTRSLERRGSTILFVSHNMFSIKSMCPRVIYLRKGEIVFDGPTDEGLKLYEADSRLAQAPWYRHEGLEPPAVSIIDVKLMDEAGAEKSVFNFGERMRVRFRYRTTRPIERPEIRVGFDRADEVHCCTFSTFDDNIDIPMIDGEGELELTTAPINMVADQYMVTFNIRERTHQLCGQLGGTFHVRHPLFISHSYGVFHQPGQWKVNTRDQQAPQLVVNGRDR